MRNQLAIFTTLLLVSHALSAQKLTINDYKNYVNSYKDIAISEMRSYGIPASITLAQGMLESGCGKSKLALGSKNHFGIKCQKEWTGDTFLWDDDAKGECFRKYATVEESFRDHSLFLTTRSRYAALFSLPLNDYKGWAYGLKQAGYATNPEYPKILIQLIEAHKLYLYDDKAFIKPEIEVLETKPQQEQNKEESDETESKYEARNVGRILLRDQYKPPIADNFEVSYISVDGRKVYENCGVPFIFAVKGDSWTTIADEFGIFSFQVYKMNDLKSSDKIESGMILYLEPKKRSNQEKTYKVKKGDSLYSIAQEKCVKLTMLLRYNKLHYGFEPEVGSIIKLSR